MYSMTLQRQRYIHSNVIRIVPKSNTVETEGFACDDMKDRLGSRRSPTGQL